jgi:hypothetical protein
MLRQYLTRLFDAVYAFLAWALLVVFCGVILTGDVYVAREMPDRARAYMRDIEFDFVDWTLNAWQFKFRQASVDEQAYLSDAERAQLVQDYFEELSKLKEVERAIATVYADPSVADPAAESAGLRAMEADLRARVAELQPSAEAILQEQVAVVAAEQGLVVGGQTIPPVSFHFTGLPYALVVSPRNEIRQAANLDVNGNLTLDERVALEDRVARGLDVSTLVVPIGGIGIYPTMVDQSSDLFWIASVVAHEWTHNYLTLRPLGVNYETTPELRTMNETTAELVGNELGRRVIARDYPDRMQPLPPFLNFLLREPPPEQEQAPPSFDFRAEMHATRVRVDELLAEEKVTEAEAYMEDRRRFFRDHGYQLRKLNQAYFAFYGAYAADAGGGAQGADPVGPAVRLLRRRSPTLKDFLDTMASFTGFEQLQVFLGLQP